MGIYGTRGGDGDILVVDDDPMIRDMLSEAMRSAGWTVDTAENGEEALRKAKDHDFKAIFLDWMMPKMTGIQCLQALRGLPRHASTVVFMLTGESNVANVSQAGRLKVREYLMKPVRLPDVLSKIKDALGEPPE